MLVDTCCGRLFVEVSGEGPDVVLWPSLLTDSGLWWHQLPRLATRYRAIAVDPPGHGRSDPTRHAYRLDDCVAAALSVLDAVHAREPAWCGLSWGGMVGMRIAVRHPQRLSALVLADCAARASPWWQRLRYGALAAVARRVGPSRALVRQIVPLFFAHPEDHPEDVRRFEEHALDLDRRSIGHAVDAVLLWRDDVTSLLAAVAVPTLVLHGREDAAFPCSEGDRLARAIPGARLVTLPRAGHLSCLEAREEFTDQVMRFLTAATRRRMIRLAGEDGALATRASDRSGRHEPVVRGPALH